MPIDSEKVEGGRYLIQRLPDFNPWWTQETAGTVTERFDSLRRGFYETHRSLIADDKQLLAIGGADRMGKTTLVRQLVSALTDPDFIEKFYRHPGFREEARDAIVPPEHVLYIPFSADPLIQLQAANQLQHALDHYETHYLRRLPDADDHFVILDDVDVIAAGRAHNSEADEFVTTLMELVREEPSRHIILTTISDRLLISTGDGEDGSDGKTVRVDRTDLLPLNFSEFLRFRYREIETTTPADRFSSRRAREALHDAINAGDPSIAADGINHEIENAVVPTVELRREVANYLTVGGSAGLALAAEGVILSDDLEAILRGRGKPEFSEVQSELRDAVRHMLRERGPELGVIGDPKKLEQLCALTAAEHPTASVRYSALVEILDVDRRTIRGKYFSVLTTLAVLTHSAEYDNLRPRSVRLYLRDPGVANAFADRDLNSVLRGNTEVETALSKSAVFDHTIRLSTLLNHRHDPKQGLVRYWQGSDGEVDFIPKIDGRPVPILWAGQRSPDRLFGGNASTDAAAVIEFLRGSGVGAEKDPLNSTLTDEPDPSMLEQRGEYVRREQYQGTLEDSTVVDDTPSFGVAITSGKSDGSATVRRLEVEGNAILEIPIGVYLRLV